MPTQGTSGIVCLMTPTSEPIDRWLKHIAGKEALRRRPGYRRFTEAVELNAQGPEIISSYGRKIFSAFVAFIDMRNFSSLARGKKPDAVRDIAKPFVDAVVEAAAVHMAIIDKTIGDEVMIVLPSFAEDALLSDAGLDHRPPIPLAASELLFDVMQAVSRATPQARLTAGIALGRLILDEVGKDGYSEWTCYGNAVNAAKRLQSVASEVVEKYADDHGFAIGALTEEEPNFRYDLEKWRGLRGSVGRLQPVQPTLEERQLKGVGNVSLLSARLCP